MSAVMTLASSSSVLPGLPASSASSTSSASGWLALLQEEDLELRAFALQQLLACVDTMWHEVAEALPELEAMAEGTDATAAAAAAASGTVADMDDTAMAVSGPAAGGAAAAPLPLELRQTAAAVASRVFFYLEEPAQALRLALDAGPHHFDPASKTTNQTPYVQRLVAAAVDAYIAARQQQFDDTDTDADEQTRIGDQKDKKSKDTKKPTTTITTITTTTTSDKQQEDVGLSIPQLQAMVDRLLEASCAAGHYEYALGIALEARQPNKVRDILMAALADTDTAQRRSASSALLKYALHAVTSVVEHKPFRQETLAVLADCWAQQFFRQQETETQTNAANNVQKAVAYDLVRTYQLLQQSTQVATVLSTLFTKNDKGSDNNDDHALLGLQLCFDLMDTGDQAFINAVAAALKQQQQQQQQQQQSTATTTETSNETTTATAATTTNNRWFEQAERVLVGGFSSELALSFLHKQSQADRLIMEHLKKILEERSSGSSRSSVLHSAAVMTHSYLVAGTTNDSFLRDYLDWMKKASNWAKFSATASLGVVHAGHVDEAMHLLQPYLPSSPDGDGDHVVSPTGGFAEGGALYALGLVHGAQAGTAASKRAEVTEFIRTHLRVSHANEVISHGACLGVGLAAMGSADRAIVQELKEVLDTDSAVAGEAAGIAIGLILVGTGAGNTHNLLQPTHKEEIMEVVAELKNYARETQHEKIIRGIALGIALMNYGQEENADASIEELRSDRDPVLRYGAMYAIALAYCGTGSNKAIRILLHTAVSDVSDDVRMAAVIALAFVLFKTPERVPALVTLLLESFNSHVRYASCMAVGIAMAGTGNAESIALLEPMLDDMTDFVRQGALIGTSMIYMQQSDTCNGRRIRSFREKLSSICGEKHQSTMTKLGAILSTGIIDAGGRNCSLVLGSRNGFTKMTSAVGLVLWLQHWHWSPMMHMFCMALTPTFTIGLNKDFKYPKSFQIICNSKPSVFAYPKKLEEKKEEKKKRVETVTLSTTAKEKARLARKRAKMGGESAMDVDKEESKTTPTTGTAAGATTTTVASTEENKASEDGTAAAADAMDVDNEESTEKNQTEVVAAATIKKTRKKKEPEPTSFRLDNPARITKLQMEVCEFDLSQRYRPVRSAADEKPFGVILLTDSTPDEEEEDDLGAVYSPALEPEGELPPPEPFMWSPPLPTTTTASEPMDEGKKDDGDEKDGEAKEKPTDGATPMDTSNPSD